MGSRRSGAPTSGGSPGFSFRETWTVYQMIYCSVCGVANREGSSYCNGCGSPLSARTEHILPDWLQDTAVTGYLWRGDVVLPDWLAELRADRELPAGAQHQLPTGDEPVEAFDLDSEEVEFSYLDEQESGPAESELLLADDLLGEDWSDTPEDAADVEPARTDEPWVGFPPQAAPEPEVYAYQPDEPAEPDNPDEAGESVDAEEPEMVEAQAPSSETAAAEGTPDEGQESGGDVPAQEVQWDSSGQTEVEPYDAAVPYAEERTDASADAWLHAEEPEAEPGAYEAAESSSDGEASAVVGRAAEEDHAIAAVSSTGLRPADVRASRALDQSTVAEAAQWLQSCVEYVLQPQPEPLPEKSGR